MNLAVLQSLALAALPLLVGYAVALIRGHIRSALAAQYLQVLVQLAQTAAHAALSAPGAKAAGTDALAATVTTLRRLAASEVAYLESLKGVPSVQALLQGLAAHALAVAGGAS